MLDECIDGFDKRFVIAERNAVAGLAGNNHFGNARHVVGYDRRVVKAGFQNIVADTCAVVAYAMRRVHQNIDFFEVAGQVADAAEEGDFVFNA